jgi:hypothetical protein
MTGHDIPAFPANAGWLVRLSGGPGSMPKLADTLAFIRQAQDFGGHHE